jgi:hypothetical protein
MRYGICIERAYSRSEAFASPLINRSVRFEIFEIIHVQSFVFAVQLDGALLPVE